MFNTNVLSAINAIELSFIKDVTLAEFKIENGLIRPYLSPSRAQNLLTFDVTPPLYEEYASSLLSLYFDSIQLSIVTSQDDIKKYRTSFYMDLKALIYSVLNNTFKTVDIFPTISSRNEFQTQCLSIASSDFHSTSFLYTYIPKSLLDFTVWLEHYFCTHASYIALIPQNERERLNTISRLRARIERLTKSESLTSKDLATVKESLKTLQSQNAFPKKISKKEEAILHLQSDLSTIRINKKSAEEKLSQLTSVGIQSSSYPQRLLSPVEFHNFDDTLYIYKGRISCVRNQHPIICVNAILQTASNQPISLNINYCVSCQKFYLSYEEYCHYLTVYKTILAKIHLISDSTSQLNLATLADESPLRLSGYSVSQGKGLSQKERETLLASLINHNLISKAATIQYLNWFIQMNGQRSGNSLAKEKWESDLIFVRKLNQAVQPSHAISQVVPYVKK